jgi:AAA15 family ATPase/GTPase
MLIQFSVENWMSFRDKASFSMVASQERNHGERITSIENNDLELLPIAAIYGGNASGKTCFFKGLWFFKTLVLVGTMPDESIPIVPFLLDSKSKDSPSSFSISILVNNDVYEFSFTATKSKIEEEKLVKINKYSDEILYHRKAGKLQDISKSFKDLDFIKFAFQGTRDNQLFLTTSISLNVEEFRPVYNWFKDCLQLIAPDARFVNTGQFFDTKHESYPRMNEILPKLDTGVSRLEGETVPLDTLKIDPNMLNRLKSQLKNNESIPLASFSPFTFLDKERISIINKNGELIAKRLVTMHKSIEGSDVQFYMRQESDGTIRIIDLLPAFLEVANPSSKKVIIADEIDRSIHPMIMRKLLEIYLNSCSADNRAQLLFTTHNYFYMEQDLLRRDEMWLTERNNLNVSNIFSLSEFKDIRVDRDIQKCYFKSKLGGTPNITLGDSFYPDKNNLIN